MTEFTPPICKISPFQTVFNDVMKEELTKHNKEKRFPLSPSTVLSCRRRLQYDLCNYYQDGAVPGESFSTRQLLIFNDGHRVEKLLAEWLAKIPEFEVIEDKHRFVIHEDPSGLVITGELDRLLLDKVSNTLKLWDAKTINTRGFKIIKDSNTPSDKNYLQQQQYLHSPKLKGMGISQGILHYYNKDTSEDLMLEFPYVKEHALYAISRHVELWKTRTLNQPRDYIFGKSWPCKKPYCPYHDFCYSNIYKDTTKVIEGEDKIIDSYKDYDKLEFIEHLTKNYGDAQKYIYKDKVIELSMLKTTIGLKVYDR